MDLVRRILHGLPFMLPVLLLVSGCASSRSAVASQSDLMYYDAYNSVSAKQYPAAIDLLSKIIVMNDAYINAYILRAYALEQERSYDSACTDLLAASRINPGNYIVHYNLGNVYFLLKDFEKAVEQYSLSISVNKSHPYSYLNRANAYIMQKKRAEALADYRAYVSMSGEQKDTILKVIAILEMPESGKGP